MDQLNCLPFWTVFSCIAYLPEVLVNVYSYCVHGSWLAFCQIQSHNYVLSVFDFKIVFVILSSFFLFIRECLSTYGHTINDDSDTTIIPFPQIQCSSSYYHGNNSNITMDEQAELISLK